MVASHCTILATTIDITLDGTASNSQFGTLDITQLKPVNALSFHCDRLTCQIQTASHASGINITASCVVQFAVRGVIGGTWHLVISLPDRPLTTFNIFGFPLTNICLCNTCLRNVRGIRYDILTGVTYSTATDVNRDVTTLESFIGFTFISTIQIPILIAIVLHLTVHLMTSCRFRLCCRIQSVAYRTQTTATVNRAQHRAALNVHRHATAHITSGICITSEATTTTEDISIYV